MVICVHRISLNLHISLLGKDPSNNYCKCDHKWKSIAAIVAAREKNRKKISKVCSEFWRFVRAQCVQISYVNLPQTVNRKQLCICKSCAVRCETEQNLYLIVYAWKISQILFKIVLG